MAKLAALVPRPRTNLTRFHGVLAPNSRYRERITPTRSVKEKKTTTDEEADGREGLDQTTEKTGHPQNSLSIYGASST